MIQTFQIQEKSGTREASFDIRGAVLCGYTGRNQAAVREHIEELVKAGVKAPPSVPTFYPKPPAGVDLGGEVYTESVETSGEIEYVLIPEKKNIWVGLGSDHTDRDLEKYDIHKSKQACPAPIARTLWNYADVKQHWDEIQIRSYVTYDGIRTLYQESTLAAILVPEDLIRLVQERVRGSLDGIALYSGTPPLLPGKFIFADLFEGEMEDPVLKRKLTLRYPIHTLDWFRK
jgi:hypothetical protein